MSHIKRIYDFLKENLNSGYTISEIAKEIGVNYIAQIKPKLSLLIYLGVIEKYKSTKKDSKNRERNLSAIDLYKIRSSYILDDDFTMINRFISEKGIFETSENYNLLTNFLIYYKDKK